MVFIFITLTAAAFAYWGDYATAAGLMTGWILATVWGLWRAR